MLYCWADDFEDGQRRRKKKRHGLGLPTRSAVPFGSVSIRHLPAAFGADGRDVWS
jgi:hypothetical protein